MSLYETSFLIRNFQRAETEAEDGAQESNESPAAKTLKDHWNKKPHRVYFLYELWLQMCSCYAAAAYPYPYLRVGFFPKPLSLWINDFGVELSELNTGSYSPGPCSHQSDQKKEDKTPDISSNTIVTSYSMTRVMDIQLGDVEQQTIRVFASSRFISEQGKRKKSGYSYLWIDSCFHNRVDPLPDPLGANAYSILLGFLHGSRIYEILWIYLRKFRSYQNGLWFVYIMYLIHVWYICEVNPLPWRERTCIRSIYFCIYLYESYACYNGYNIL